MVKLFFLKKKRSLFVGACFSRQEREGHWPRYDCGHHHGPWWTPWSSRGRQPLPCTPGFMGSGQHGLPVVLPTAHGDPIFSYILKRCLVFVPLHYCTRQLHPNKVPFQAFIKRLYIEDEDSQSREWNLIEWLQHPVRLYFEKPEQLTCSKPVSYL